MNVIALPAFTDNYIWLILNEKKNTFICIDPGDAEPVLRYAKNNNLHLDHILITHHHSDHAGGILKLIDSFPLVKIYGPKDLRIFGLTHFVKDEDIIHIADLAFRIIAIPGHTASHICYHEPHQDWLFTGDTLFSAGCGKVFDGTIEQLFHAIQLLKKFPDQTLIFCGHEYTRNNLKFAMKVEPNNEKIQSYFSYLSENKNLCSLPSTLALEKEINPFMRTTEHEVISYAKAQGLKKLDPFEVFKVLRHRKDEF